MSEPLRGVIVSHGTLGAALADAVTQITGDATALCAVSNRGHSADTLGRVVGEALGTAPAVVFVDMPGGSCLRAALMQLRERPDLAVVSGVNLPMLLDFVYHRDLSPKAAAVRAVEHGGKAIRTIEP